jgi:hypothetical protein
VLVNAIALNGDEAGSNIRRNDLQFDFLAWIVIGFVQLDLQLRVLVQFHGEIRRSHDAEGNSVQFVELFI